MSPLVQSYQEWTFGRPYGDALPRQWLDFLSGAFGPLAPMLPVAIDVPEESGRPEPRRFQYNVGWNIPIGTPGSEGLKLASFATLRYLADVASVVRACIRVRQEEILGLDWDIALTKDAQLSVQDDAEAMSKYQRRRDEALAFFKRPDPNYPSFQSWLGALLEELFVVDAVSLYIHPPRVQGKGLFGSNLAALDLLDGTTIRPLLDVRGGIPQPPNVAYQQYEWGVPRADLMSSIAGADIRTLDISSEQVQEYRGDQLLYLPYVRRTWTPYGFPAVERALIPSVTQLRRQEFRLEFFTEGSIPGLLVIAGEQFSTPEQVRQLQDTLNALAGDQAFKHKVVVLPSGSTSEPMKPVDLATGADENLYVEVLMAFEVAPSDIGLPMMAGRGGLVLGGSGGAAEMLEAGKQRRALRPLTSWLKDNVFDFVLQQVCGQADLEWVWTGLEEAEDESAKLDRVVLKVKSGLESIDEGRAELGMDPWGLDATSGPVLELPTGLEEITDEEPEPQPAALATGAQQEPAPPEDGKPNPDDEESPREQAAPEQEDAQQGTDKPATKAAHATRTPPLDRLAEIDTLRRYLKKGRSYDTFTPNAIPAHWLTHAHPALTGSPEATIRKLRQQTQADDQRDNRRKRLEEIAAASAVALGSSVRKLRRGKTNPAAFLDHATTVLNDGYLQAAQAASKAAAARFDIDELDNETLKEMAAQLAGDQHPYLQGLMQDVLAGVSRQGAKPTSSPDNLRAALEPRLALYAKQSRQIYERAYARTLLAARPDAAATWLCLGPEPCDLCGPRDEQQYTADALPGWPGDGGFGDVCEGGPNCNCELDWNVPEDANQ